MRSNLPGNSRRVLVAFSSVWYSTFGLVPLATSLGARTSGFLFFLIWLCINLFCALAWNAWGILHEPASLWIDFALSPAGILFLGLLRQTIPAVFLPLQESGAIRGANTLLVRLDDRRRGAAHWGSAAFVIWWAAMFTIFAYLKPNPPTWQYQLPPYAVFLRSGVAALSAAAFVLAVIDLILLRSLLRQARQDGCFRPHLFHADGAGGYWRLIRLYIQCSTAVIFLITYVAMVAAMRGSASLQDPTVIFALPMALLILLILLVDPLWAVRGAVLDAHDDLRDRASALVEKVPQDLEDFKGISEAVEQTTKVLDKAKSWPLDTKIIGSFVLSTVAASVAANFDKIFGWLVQRIHP